LEGLGIENVGIFYGHLQYFTAIWNILWPLGNVMNGNLVYFSPFWYIVSRKIRQPWFSGKVYPVKISSVQPISYRLRFCSNSYRFDSRVARWFVFKPKIPIWVNF
jgi:hypothetical protein